MWAGRDLFDEKQDWIHLLEHLFNDKGRSISFLRKCVYVRYDDDRFVWKTYKNREEYDDAYIAREEVVGRIWLDDRKKAGMHHALSTLQSWTLFKLEIQNYKSFSHNMSIGFNATYIKTFNHMYFHQTPLYKVTYITLGFTI